MEVHSAQISGTAADDYIQTIFICQVLSQSTRLGPIQHSHCLGCIQQQGRTQCKFPKVGVKNVATEATDASKNPFLREMVIFSVQTTQFREEKYQWYANDKPFLVVAPTIATGMVVLAAGIHVSGINSCGHRSDRFTLKITLSVGFKS